MVDEEELRRAGYEPSQYPNENFTPEEINENSQRRHEYIEDSNKKLDGINIQMVDLRHREKMIKWCIIGFIIGIAILGGILYYTAKEGYWNDVVTNVCGNFSCPSCENVCNTNATCQNCGDCYCEFPDSIDVNLIENG